MRSLSALNRIGLALEADRDGAGAAVSADDRADGLDAHRFQGGNTL